MNPTPHAPADLEALRAFTVPTLSNAIETFGVRPPDQGFCDARLHCHYPGMPLMLGYAVTATVGTAQPRTGIREADYWAFVAQQAGPKVAVVQDLDRPARGAMWGEWNAHVHKALGCIGMVTDGAARDLDAVQQLGFHFFSSSVLPSHAYGVFIGYGDPLEVAGLRIETGDLLAGDQHGVLLIPADIPLGDLARAAAEIDRLEGRIFTLCRSADFSLDRLIALDTEIAAAWPGAERQGTG